MTGKIIASGFIDMHCHLREPGFEYKETIKTGIDSAIAGGYCAICPMPNTNPVNDNSETLNFIKNKDKRIYILPICALTKNLESKELTDMMSLKNQGAIAFSDDGKPFKNKILLKNALNKDILIISHSEKPELKGSKESEFEAIEQEINLLQQTNGNLHFAHVSCEKSVDIIRKAKQNGLKITCETAPHYFSLFKTKENSQNTIFKVNPPLRDTSDINAIIEGLKDGTIDVIATDHAPHSIEEKQKKYSEAPNGLCGFETSTQISFSYLKNHLTINEIIEKYSTNPAKILGLNNFGRIIIGNEANLTILDPLTKYKIKGKNFKSKCKLSPFEGKNLAFKSIGCVIKGKYYEN